MGNLGNWPNFSRNQRSFSQIPLFWKTPRRNTYLTSALLGNCASLMSRTQYRRPHLGQLWASRARTTIPSPPWAWSTKLSSMRNIRKTWNFGEPKSFKERIKGSNRFKTVRITKQLAFLRTNNQISRATTTLLEPNSSTASSLWRILTLTKFQWPVNSQSRREPPLSILKRRQKWEL